MDSVSLILAIENAFQIHIPDHEANMVSTVNDLQQLVISKLQGGDSAKCLTSAAFYRTRRGMVETLGVDRHEIRPSTPIERILPRRDRRDKWQHIQEATKLALPALQHPNWIQYGFLVLGFAVAIVTGIYAQASFGGMVFLFLLGLVIGGLLIKFSPGLAVAFPNHNATVGDLARDVLAMNHARISQQIGSFNKEEVKEAICRLIFIATAVARDKITPEARLVGDLGID